MLICYIPTLNYINMLFKCRTVAPNSLHMLYMIVGYGVQTFDPLIRDLGPIIQFDRDNGQVRM